jgi:hypothetical protein
MGNILEAYIEVPTRKPWHPILFDCNKISERQLSSEYQQVCGYFMICLIKFLTFKIGSFDLYFLPIDFQVGIFKKPLKFVWEIINNLGKHTVFNRLRLRSTIINELYLNFHSIWKRILYYEWLNQLVNLNFPFILIFIQIE